MVTELRAAMVNGRILSDGWTAEVVFAAGARSGSVAECMFDIHRAYGSAIIDRAENV